MSLTLVSFNLSPYSSRVTATLNYLHIPCEIKYIDMANKPEWFLKLCPTEKVPILLVGDKVIFESLVILEYINSLSPKSLLPADNLERAINRSRAEFSGEILPALTATFSAITEAEFNEKLADLKWYFSKIEDWLKETKFIHSNEITLADFAYIPIFFLVEGVKPLTKFNFFEGFPRLQEYGQALLSLEGVPASKSEDYAQSLQGRIKERNPYFLTK